MDASLNRVETLLKNSDKALYLHQIATLADVTEHSARANIKALSAMGQIEVIATPGRWGNRYAWLAAKTPVIPVAGEQKPVERVDSVNESEPESIEAALQPLVDRLEIQNNAVLSQSRYAVAVPKRPLRIVKSRTRAEALALAAVRRGAKGAEVFELMPVGRARKDASFHEVAL